MTDAQTLALLVGGSGAAAGLVVDARRRDQVRRDVDRVVLDVVFPRDLSGSDVASALAGVVGSQAPVVRGISGVHATVLEVVATADRVRHRLVVPGPRLDSIRNHVHAAVPGMRLDESEPTASDALTAAVELRLNTHQRPLRKVDDSGVSRAILAALRSLGRGEVVVVQWVLTPAAHGQPVKRARKTTAGLPLTQGVVYQLDDPEDVRAARAKQSTPGYWAVMRVGAKAANTARARALIRRATAALSMTGAPGVHFVRRRLPSALVVSRAARRSTPLGPWPILINSEELIGLLGWPIDSPVIPGLELAAGRRFATSASIPISGRVIAKSNYPGQDRTLAQAASSLSFHAWVVGPTGSGKSHLLTSLIAQDIAAGRSVVVIDGKSDLVDAVLEHIPPDREADVVLIDAAATRPTGINPLAGSGPSSEVVADQLFGTLTALWELRSAPRTGDLLHASLLTLAQTPGLTLVELLPLLINPTFRRSVTAALSGDLVLGPFWAAYEAMSEGERAQVIAPLLTRLRQFLMRSTLRGVLGQQHPAISIGAAIDSGKIVLVSLAAGRIGSESAALLGAITLGELWTATQARANQTPDRRRLTSVYVDEFQTIAHLPTDLADVLAQSRGYGVGYTLANQSPTQLSPRLREAVSVNCRTKIAFATSHYDATNLARDFGHDVTGADIQGLARYEVLASIATGAVASPPATGVTLPMPEGNDRAEQIRALAEARFGQDRAEVEAALRDRLETAAEPGATARKRRQT